MKKAIPEPEQKSIRSKLKQVFADCKKVAGETRVNVLNVFSDNFYGIRLFKPGATKLGYLTALLILYLALFLLPKSFLRAFDYINFTEQVPAVVTVLLTVLLSAGFVFLGDDTRGWSLARLTIIKDVVKLKGLIIAVSLICIIGIVPDYRVFDYSLKTLLSPLLVLSFLYILGIFVRVYRWLSDLAADPSLFDGEGEGSESRIFPSSSYRFARIVYLIHHNNRRDAWQSILERKIPEGYEELIHEEFFKSSNKMLESLNSVKLQELSLMLEIYDKYYSRRNLDSWRFYLDYTKRFLVLYAGVRQLLDERRRENPQTRIKYASLYRGRAALERITARLITASFTEDKVWHLFEAMDTYVEADSLTELRGTRIKDNKVIGGFIDELYETIFKDEISGYEIGSYIHEKGNWKVTEKALYDDKNNIGWVMLKHFEEWLFRHLDKNEDGEYLPTVDQVVELVFPEVSPIDLGRLYWFMYNAKNTSDMKAVVESIYKDKRPIGHIGRMYGEFEMAGEGATNLKEHIAKEKTAGENTIELFAHTHYQYFSDDYWNINSIISEGTKKIKGADKKDRGAIRVEMLVEDMKAIKKVFEVDKKKAEDAKKS